VELNVRLLARDRRAFNMPIVLSTVGVAAGINGPTHPALLAELPGVPVIDRGTMSAFEDRAFREAVKKTGRMPSVGDRKRRTARPSSGCHTQAPSRIRRSRSSASCSATGRHLWQARRAR
jgi:hypothetical protein